jgi:hypothetical protein
VDVWCLAGGDAVGCRALQVGLVGRYGVDTCREYEPLLVARAGQPQLRNETVTNNEQHQRKLPRHLERSYNLPLKLAYLYALNKSLP